MNTRIVGHAKWREKHLENMFTLLECNCSHNTQHKGHYELFHDRPDLSSFFGHDTAHWQTQWLVFGLHRRGNLSFGSISQSVSQSVSFLSPLSLTYTPNTRHWVALWRVCDETHPSCGPFHSYDERCIWSMYLINVSWQNRAN